VSGFTFASRASIPDDVMVRELGGESVLLNLSNSQYYGLDAVGADMWQALTTAGSLQDAYERLLAEYDVTPETLRQDLEQLVEKLAAQGLIRLEG